jgi:urease accessory protein
MAMPGAENGWNVLEVASAEGFSRLTRCLGLPPVKFINPRPEGGCCQVYVSTYGGGMVDGDSIRMRVDCRPGSRLYLGTQASTKVYKGAGRDGCRQETVGTVHADALAVICPDPVVPFAESRYRQSQSWEVHPRGDLIVLDWLQPGRSARGEVFAYRALASELRITRPGGAPVLVERFALEPGAQDPFRCGRFGAFRSFLTAALIGPRAERLGEALEEKLPDLNRSGRAWIGIGRREGAGWLLRGMGEDRHDLQPVHDLLFAALAEPAWLGFNPWLRRY